MFYSCFVSGQHVLSNRCEPGVRCKRPARDTSVFHVTRFQWTACWNFVIGGGVKLFGEKAVTCGLSDITSVVQSEIYITRVHARCISLHLSLPQSVSHVFLFFSFSMINAY